MSLGYFGEYFDNGKPIEENWINRLHSEDFSSLINYQQEYQTGALRYDVGEHSNFILVPMMLKALEQLNNWGVDRIQEYCKTITADSVLKLKENGFIIEEARWRGNHLFGVRLPSGTDLEKVKVALLKHKVYVSVRGNSIRVAPNVYNHELDMKRLTKVLFSETQKNRSRG
jgi:selenocysteine lyase/cysteine desulfurase